MKTLFEEVKEELKLQPGDSGFFYRKALRSVAVKYASDPKRLILDEQRDSADKDHQDKNVLRTFPKPGHLLFFEYQPKSSYSKFSDKFPMVYIMGVEKDYFIGANLHFIDPQKRKLVVEQLQKNKIMFPPKCIGRYKIDHVNGLFLDVAKEEWITAAFIPVEHFVKINKGKEMPINVSEVWKETNKSFGDALTGTKQTKLYSDQVEP
jgi:hypothetical protein